MTRRQAAAAAVTAVLVAAFLVTAAAFQPAVRSAAAQAAPSSPPAKVCGSQVLHSPWNYTGAAGPYSSGTAGLPTYGAAGTDFPDATAGQVIPAGDNTSAASSGAYQASNTVYYFEPGTHSITNIMWTGDNAAYVGGYTAGAGPAVLDGGGQNSYLSRSHAAPGDQVDDTWEYLTIKNYTSSTNNYVMGNEDGGSGTDKGDTYLYDTIGPNEYGWTDHGAVLNTTSAPGQGGGYGIGVSDNTTIKDSCLTQNAQGGFGGFGANVTVSGDELAANGLGEYPDSGGNSPNACGCSGGGKLLGTINAAITGNYVHDNYNAGIWLDFDNAGATVAGNYIASNWGTGIEYEASYNASISDNTLTGNGWASDGAWPSGYQGNNSCFGGQPCSGGYGAITGGGGFPYSAIYLPNSGGNANLSSDHAGQLLVQGNLLINNFGGVGVYTDTNRYPGNINQDSACSDPLAGMSSTYHRQPKVLTTNGDSTISGSSVSSTGGTVLLCSGHDTYSGQVTAPSVGMGIYDLNSARFLGNIASVSSANSFTLDRSPGDESGASLMVSGYGGCGPADYYGGGLGVHSGSPATAYWDNCIWGSRSETISGNTFSTDASVVTNCTAATKCGYQMAIAYLPGIPALMQYWSSYATYIARASGGLGNVWSQNSYCWQGGGPGSWSFEAGNQGTQVSLADWRGSPLGQDVGSTFATRACQKKGLEGHLWGAAFLISRRWASVNAGGLPPA